MRSWRSTIEASKYIITNSGSCTMAIQHSRGAASSASRRLCAYPDARGAWRISNSADFATKAQLVALFTATTKVLWYSPQLVALFTTTEVPTYRAWPVYTTVCTGMLHRAKGRSDDTSPEQVNHMLMYRRTVREKCGTYNDRLWNGVEINRSCLKSQKESESVL
ncbi:hypothetical protein BC827DRAFT_82170 [Russula dissimulans]|nr:hypothetical protein BC827DRAFT_82170 [Russula dissimulans]